MTHVGAPYRVFVGNGQACPKPSLRSAAREACAFAVEHDHDFGMQQETDVRRARRARDPIDDAQRAACLLEAAHMAMRTIAIVRAFEHEPIRFANELQHLDMRPSRAAECAEELRLIEPLETQRVVRSRGAGGAAAPRRSFKRACPSLAKTRYGGPTWATNCRRNDFV